MPATQKIAAIYARVSTTDQADKGYSLPMQIEACLAFAKAHDYTVSEDMILRENYTGTSLNRPALKTLRDMVQHCQIQAAITYDLDRLSRKLAHQLLMADEFEQAGIALHVVSMPTAEKTPEAQLLSKVRGIIAEYERAKILERTMRGLRGRAKEGFVPSGNVPLGYEYVRLETKGAHYIIKQEEATLVQRIFQMYVQSGFSINAIAQQLTRERVPTQSDRRNRGSSRKMNTGTW
jgi:site-specific DNA recombinase